MRVWLVGLIMAATTAWAQVPGPTPLEVVAPQAREMEVAGLWAPRSDQPGCHRVRSISEGARGFGIGSGWQYVIDDRVGGREVTVFAPVASHPPVLRRAVGTQMAEPPIVLTLSLATCLSRNAVMFERLAVARTAMAQERATAEATQRTVGTTGARSDGLTIVGTEVRRPPPSGAEAALEARERELAQRQRADFLAIQTRESGAAGRAFQERYPNMPNGREPVPLARVLNSSWWAPVHGHPFCERARHPAQWASGFLRAFGLAAEVVDYYEVSEGVMEAQVYFFTRTPTLAFMSTDRGRCHRFHELLGWQHAPAPRR